MARRVRDLIQITSDELDSGLTPRRCDENYFAYNWSRRMELKAISGSTVGILGLGEIGLELTKRLAGFNCQIVYNKRMPLPAKVEATYNMRCVSRDELAVSSDFVCCLLPNLPENNQSVDSRFFSLMKRGACFAHCGAPGVVNEQDLVTQLSSGHLGGAAVDCFTYEPLPSDSPLANFARIPDVNVLLTPHVAAGVVSANASERARDFVNIMAVTQGRTLAYRIA